MLISPVLGRVNSEKKMLISRPPGEKALKSAILEDRPGLPEHLEILTGSNRLRGAPIPRPVSIECGACKNFQRIDHKFLGQCAVGEFEAPAGLVDSDKRYCVRFLPNKSSFNVEL